MAALTIGLLGCNGDRSSLCQAYDTLRSAVRAMDAARVPAAARDQAAFERQMDDVDRLVRVARGQLAGGGADARTASAARAMLEAANYLEYMTGQFRSTGSVDFSLTQFASRELTRAASGAGGSPLNC